ncbi:MAG: hypothetical protein IJW31_02380 [Lentisphaeria bacterium]|nr:hypothetical protein [Lentisphaeria bacterium]
MEYEMQWTQLPAYVEDKKRNLRHIILDSSMMPIGTEKAQKKKTSE